MRKQDNILTDKPNKNNRELKNESFYANVLGLKG